jgi:hypothetical protein
MDDSLPVPGQLTRGSVDVLILLGAVVLVSVILFVWITFFRKRGRRRRRVHTAPQTHRPEQPAQKAVEAPPQVQKAKKKRHGKNVHYPLNPTLAQTGGLPPPRPLKTPPDLPPPS